MTGGGEASAPLDILSDLTPIRASRGRCDIALLRLERPDLAEQYDRVLAVIERGEKRYSDRDIADWITAKGYSLTEGVVSRHRRKQCVLCRTTSSLT